MLPLPRVLAGAALGTFLLAACSSDEPLASGNLVVRAALGLSVPNQVYALGVYAERLNAGGMAVARFAAEVNADDSHFVAPFDVIPNVGAQAGDRVRITVVAYGPPQDGIVRSVAMRRAELAWPADGRMLRLGLTARHVNNVYTAKVTLPVRVETAAAFAPRRCQLQEAEDNGARCVPLTSVAVDLPAVDPQRPPPDACVPATCLTDSALPVCDGYEPCSYPVVSYVDSSRIALGDGSCSFALPERLDERVDPTFSRDGRLLTPNIDYTFDRASRMVTFSADACANQDLGFTASAHCEPPSAIATAVCGERAAKDAVPTPSNANNTFVLAPSQSSLTFEPLPFDDRPSMLTVVGEGTVYAVLGSENRLWLRPGWPYWGAEYQWRPAVSFERSGAAFRALHGYTVPQTRVDEPPRVYVAESDASLRPVTLEGIGAPVEFCAAPASCRTTADVLSVAGPSRTRGAVWMVRDPDGIAFYTEESPSRFVRSALAPIAGASHVLELADDPPGVATVIEREGMWSLVRLTADVAIVREELPLPDGFAYVHLGYGEDVGGVEEPVNALHILVAGSEGGEAALQIDPGALSLNWRWRASVPADTSWYSRSLGAWWGSQRHAGCYLSGTELISRDSEGAEAARTPDVLAASRLHAELFGLQEETAGKYAATVLGNDGPMTP
jgi:hypothetical protein